MVYSGIFRTIDLFSQFQARFSGITQEQFMLILNFVQANSGIFRTLAYLGTPIQVYSQSYILGYIYRGIISHIREYFSRFRHIQDPCVTASNSANQHLLFKSGSSFKSLQIMEHFFIFVSKVDIQHLALQDNNNNNRNMPSTPLTHRRQHVIHTNTPPTLPTLHTLPTSPTPTMLARYPRKHATHAIHAGTSSGSFL